MGNRVLALFFGCVIAAGAAGCGPEGAPRRPRGGDDEEKQSKTESRMGPLRVVWGHTEKFKACYEEARRVHSDLQLRVTLDISVDGKGHVTNAYLSSAKPLDETLKRCLVRVAEGISFPASGESFTVKPAIVFQP